MRMLAATSLSMIMSHVCSSQMVTCFICRQLPCMLAAFGRSLACSIQVLVIAVLNLMPIHCHSMIIVTCCRPAC